MSEQDVTHQQTKVLLPAIPLLAMTPRDAFYANTEVIPLKEASGRIIAEFVMVYPPWYSNLHSRRNYYRRKHQLHF
nr:hypothetical protein P5651_16965 [Bacillus subtilis]